MKTKCIVLGESQPKPKKKKIIEFTHLLDSSGEMSEITEGDGFFHPSEFKHIELVCKHYTTNGLDLMFTYGENRNEAGAMLLLGYWNDGVVE